MVVPYHPGGGSGGPSSSGGGGPAGEAKEVVLTGAAGKTWYAGTEYDAPRDADGKFAYGWHWNSPYRVKRDVPDLFRKEVERYVS